jgi:hypothetical protein
MALSTYYDAKTRPMAARARSDALLGPALVALSEDNYCVYGAHKLWKAARRAGHDVGRDQARAEPVRFRFTSRGRFFLPSRRRLRVPRTRTREHRDHAPFAPGLH